MFDKIKSSAAFKRFKQAMKPLVTFLKKFIHDWSLHFAAMLAYSLLVAIVPIAVATLGIIGLVLKNHPDTRLKFVDAIVNLVPNSKLTRIATEEIVAAAIDQLTKDAGALVALGFVFSILGASRLFGVIDKTLTVIYRIPQRSFIRRNLVAMGMVFVFIGLFTIIIAVGSAPSLITDEMSYGIVRAAIYFAGIAISLLLSFILFELIYWLIPNKKMPLNVTWCGALVAACLLEIVVVSFPIYVQNNTKSYTGIIGFTIIFILLLYYFSLILILGAQINAYYFEDYLPFQHGIAQSLSRVYHEENHGDPRKRLVDKNRETIPLQQQ